MNATEFQRASDPVFFTYASGDAVFRLRTRLSNGYGRVVTAPVIRTVNNTPATVFASTTDYILSSVTTANGVGGVNTFTTPQAIQIGTVLSVTPRINGDGTISMGLAPTVSTITGTRSIAVSATTNQEVPIFTTQSVTAVIIVKDGDTIVLGGLNTDSTNTLVNRVPVLSDLPIVGQFFKRTQKQKTSSELLIFVTPKIIDDSETGFNP
jgi:type II secretory pathway component GspD/PulD (secretin)